MSVLTSVVPVVCLAQTDARLSAIHNDYPEPVLASDNQSEVAVYDDSLAAAIAEAYAGNPELAAKRYDLRAIDDQIGVALSQARPSAQLQVSSGYDLIVPGDITQASRSLSDRLNDPNITENDLTSQLVVDQAVWTGGRVSSAVRAAKAASLSGVEILRGEEGDLLLELIIAYSDVRRDTQTLAIRRSNVASLSATVKEIAARQVAGELTRTDIAQGEVQLQAAEVQLRAAAAQLQSSRASFASIVGRAPGQLAPAPELDGLPESIDEAFGYAEAANPELAASIAAERESRALIVAAKAEGAPQLYLRGTAGTNGPVSPFDRRDHDISFAARATVTIPLSAGGRIRSQVAQARNRNTADEYRVEATRRQLVRSVVTAWNQWASAEHSIAAQKAQVRAARIFYEGTLSEYREGLRSTFDVLFGLNSVRDAEIALLASRRNSYVAQAALLRQMGQLEVRKLMEGAALYDPAIYTRKVRNRNAVPWAGLVRTIDRLGAPRAGRLDPWVLPVSDAHLVPVPKPVKAPAEVTTSVSRPPHGAEISAQTAEGQNP